MDKLTIADNQYKIRRLGQPWLFTLRLLAFWMLFFTAFRIWFIAWLHAEWTDPNPWPALWQAWPLDMSMAGYLLIIPVLLWFAGLLAGARWRTYFEKGISGFNVFAIGLLIFVFGANIFIYQEWHTPLNNRALQYFQTPASMVDSMSFGFQLGSVLAYAVLFWVWWRLYRWLIGTGVYTTAVSVWNIAWLPTILPGLFLAIRGGLGVMPINESAVYYSPHMFNNHAATNTAWHVVHSLIESRSTTNHYRAMDEARAQKELRTLLDRDTAVNLSHQWMMRQPGQMPNVVIIMMESMTAQVVEEMGGVAGACPNLGRLAREGLLFDQCYGSGYRTEQGLVSVLGGFPAQPDQSIVLLEDKASKLSSIPKILKDNGYSTVFFYGGDLTFANIGVWLTCQKFERIISKKDFKTDQITQRWGADDREAFGKAIAMLRQTQQPFFSTILTLSLHPPYDVPFTSRWTGTSEREMFLNSAAFADDAIGDFFRQARQEPWYSNTLFVLVADHGHYNPEGVRMDDPRSRKVPLILTGPLIAPDWRGKRIHTIGNHHDIPATVLDELGFSADSFPWSKDLFDPQTKDFAFYTNENGLGWVTPGGVGFYLFPQKKWQFFTGTLKSEEREQAQAYLQQLYQDFLSK